MTLRYELHSEHVYRVLEQTLIPPTTVHELDPDVINRAASRLDSTVGSVSESYMVNSEFTNSELKRLPSPNEANDIRNYFFQTAVDGYEKSRGTRWSYTWSSDDLTAQILSPIWTNPVATQALFEVDVMALVNGQLWRQIPGRQGALFEQHVSDHFIQEVSQQIYGISQDLSDSFLFFLVGSHARTQFIHGIQAARAMMQSAGMILGALTNQALALRMRPSIISHFNNSAMNNLIAADGVDRAVVALLSVRPKEEYCEVNSANEKEEHA